MKYIIALIVMIFSLNSFAYLEDFSIAKAKDTLEWQLGDDVPHFDYSLQKWATNAAVGGLKNYGAEVIYKKDEYLQWKQEYLGNMQRLVSFLEMAALKDNTEKDKRFIAIATLVAKYFQDQILKDSLTFAKYLTNLDNQANMSNIWPGNYFVINPKKMADMMVLDDRAELVVFFHELVHSYYTDNGTKPTSGPDAFPQRVLDCRYQENIAYAASIRLLKLMSKHDRNVDFSNYSSSMLQANAAFENPQLWTAFIGRYCGVAQ